MNSTLPSLCWEIGRVRSMVRFLEKYVSGQNIPKKYIT